ncbi:MAG: 2-dehydropantoate 2-reductase [Gemmatimonadales bacterium]
MRIAVFGAGAVGGYFGGRLAEGGEDVVFVARGAHLTALRERGLHVESVVGDFAVAPARCTDDPEEVGPADLVLVGTKAWQVTEAAPAMRPLIGPTTTVLPLQNGVEAPDQLSAALGREHVLGGLCRIMSFLAEPGVIRHVGAEPVLTFGELDGRETGRCRRLLGVFGSARGMRAELVPDVQVELWRKLQMMAATSAVGTAAREPFGVLLRLPETRRLLMACMDEVRAVAVARGVLLPAAEADRTMAFLDQLPADGVTSLYRDMTAGRPSELEAQLGAVVRLGVEVRVDTPVCGTLYATLLPAELKARGELPGP